jgi:hypothetical protein
MGLLLEQEKRAMNSLNITAGSAIYSCVSVFLASIGAGVMGLTVTQEVQAYCDGVGNCNGIQGSDSDGSGNDGSGDGGSDGS